VRNQLIREKKLSKEMEAALKGAIEAFVPQYKAPGSATTTSAKSTAFKEGEAPIKPRETNVKEGEPPVGARS
jgi:hypothetical protein